MPRKSSIKSLPSEILTEVNHLLGDDLATLDEIVAQLQGMGHERSRSALGRHKQQLDKVASKLRRSREMANALVKEIGPDAAEGKTGRMLVEILQSLAFDFLMKRAGDDGGDEQEDMVALDFARIGKALKDMASAQKIDVDRELKIRQETAKKASETAEKAVKEVGRKHGFKLPKEALTAIREQVYGIVDQP